MVGIDALIANVLPIEFPFTAFDAWRRPVVDGEDLAALREENRDRWHVQWDGGHLYVLRLADDAPEPSDAELVELEVDQALRLLARLVTDALVRRFPTYEPLRQKPFVFLGRKVELMQDVGSALRLDHPLLGEFRVWPKYSLDGRVIEVRDGSPFVGITVDLATRWEVTAGLQELARAGVDLAGLYVVRRSPDPDQRRLVGRIASVGSRDVELAEAVDVTSVAVDDVMLEGRRDAFARCLSALLGPTGYARYDAYRDQRMGDVLGGPALLQEVQRVARVLAQGPLSLASGLVCSVSPPLHIMNTARYKTVVPSRQLDYCFDPARSKRHRYAWPGLEAYGPFSRDTFAHPSPRLLVVFPPAAKGAVEAFVRSLRDGIPGQKGFAAGMAKTFGLVNPRFEFVPVRNDAGRTPAENYRKAIETALAQGDLPDAALVVVTDRDGDLPETQNPYLHSKAILLMAGVAAQEARLSTITRRHAELQYVLQNISVALYAKMNGVPWTVDHDLTIADELVIGVGTAELSESRTSSERQRYVGITTVFRGDGNYLLGQLSREATYSDYPVVLRDSTRDVIEEVKKRNGWQPGDTVRLIFHAARPPRNVDFATLMRDAVAAVGKDLHVEFAFLTVSHDHPFALFDTSQPGRQTPKGRKGEYAPDRGLLVQTGRYSRLISTSGVTLVKRAGLPLPRPIQVHLHRSSTFKDLHYLSEQVVKFTGLSWRSTQPAADPVTIYYSELIARLLGRLKAVPDWSPALLDARLRTSKWFI
jgi:hypothetical protein